MCSTFAAFHRNTQNIKNTHTERGRASKNQNKDGIFLLLCIAVLFYVLLFTDIHIFTLSSLSISVSPFALVYLVVGSRAFFPLSSSIHLLTYSFRCAHFDIKRSIKEFNKTKQHKKIFIILTRVHFIQFVSVRVMYACIHTERASAKEREMQRERERVASECIEKQAAS